ncbi:MAG: sodium:calcium antiporter [Crenarchaeota archaeon]|nr:MAG: sodium:calcium antiporter [Thermoproteota archaeon]RDJ33819.1 MAG: sodium:calcium antiporter [Thermoproteota archaeon]RDJ37072.1 MAG: sodium:calcium antiporter [Thermoproteota archaeon]RDJ37393.1 MAG: sodium:calcium antiporter [Thermoproteota archaeon]
MELIVNGLLVIAGLALLCFGGNWLVTGGVTIAKKIGISQLVIGMTVVAYGTSTPELAASIAAAGEHGDIILGNIVGSNIANVGMVIGIASILIPLAVSKTTLRKEIPIMLGISLLLIALSIDGELSQYDGIIFLGAMIAFSIFTYKDAQKHRDTNQNGTDEKNTNKKNVYLKSFGLIGLGISLLYVGAILTVDNAVILAESLGISERIIGLTVIAIGTSLPELITSVIAIKKGHTDIGVGNIIGSNIYNILMIMGVAATIASVAVSTQVMLDYAIMVGFSLTLLIAIKSGVINRTMGILLTMGYVAYLAFAFFMP